jgi:hypothetical protein
MVYDSFRHVCVLTGADTGSGGPNPDAANETWEYNGTVWTLRVTAAFPTPLGPMHLSDLAMAYDSDRHVSVLFGGINGTGETWEWNGTAWAVRSSTGPMQRYFHAMAYDRNRHVTVLTSGAVGILGGGYTYFPETWEWNGATWTNRNAAHAPALRDMGMVFDTTLGVCRIFGGRTGPDESQPRRDTIEYPTIAPTITQQPMPVVVCPGGSFSLTVAASGTGPTYQWRRNTTNLSGNGATTPTYAKSNATSFDTGLYDCVVTNLCGTATTVLARVAVCPADFNCSGTLSVQDIFDFLALYFAHAPRADFNGSGAVSVQDIFDFLAAYFAGCA